MDKEKNVIVINLNNVISAHLSFYVCMYVYAFVYIHMYVRNFVTTSN